MKYTERNHAHVTEKHRAYHEKHGVIPVDYYRRAPWFEKRIVKHFGIGRLCDARFNWRHVERRFDTCPHFDHFGTIRFDGHLAFVTEPYVWGSEFDERLYRGFVRKCQWLADEIGCDWWASTHSFWNPGACARGVFYEGANTLPYKLLKSA